MNNEKAYTEWQREEYQKNILDRKTKAEKICDKIIKDLSDRRGLGDEWDQIDEDIQQEIKDTWCKIIEAILESISYKKVNYE